MQLKFLLPFLICFLQVAPVYPQTPSYYHYTSSEGLASSTVYKIIQDRNGFIWFATMNGMSRFDGQRFVTFRTKDGLNSNSIISLAEGRSGELYIGNYEKGINVFRDGHIGDYCSGVNGKSIAISYLLLDTTAREEQKLYAYRTHGMINVISETRDGTMKTNGISSFPVLVNRLERLPDGKIAALTTTGMFSFRNESVTRMKITGLPDTNIFCMAAGTGGSYYLGTRGVIYNIRNHIVTRRYKISIAGNNDVCALLRDRNKNIWFSLMNRGFFLIQAGSDSIIDIGTRMGLQNTLVNDYLEDNEGNIWVSTYGKGVFCLNNLYLKSYSESDGMSSNSVYSIVQARPGSLLIGTFNGLNLLENGKFTLIRSHSKKTLTEIVYRIKKVDDGFYLGGTFGGEEMINVTFRGLRFYMHYPPSFSKISTGQYLFGSAGNYLRVQQALDPGKKGASRFIVFGDSTTVNRINDIFEDAAGNVWIGTALGLCRVNIRPGKQGVVDWKRTFFPDNPVLNARINSIFEDGEHKVWFAGEKGVACYHPGKDSFETLTISGGYDLSAATSVITDNKKRPWIGTMNGLYLLDGGTVKYLDRQTGLPSNEVLSLSYNSEKNLLYVGTSNGISFLDAGLFDSDQPTPPKVQIINMKAGDSVYTQYDHLVFEPEQHHVYINFKALDFSSPGSVRYRYNLNGEWAETDRDYLDFLALPNGKYVLQIMARSQNSGWGKPCSLTFEVRPRIDETVWFRLGLLLIIVGMVITGVTWRLRLNNKKIRQEMELTERINELKHQALSAMMNPHFIFNSLNSVQYLINCARNEDANDYIALMARLIRKNLDSAGSGFILLSEEINRLTLYLDLEKLRFQERFTYEIITGTEVETDSIMIPNMIIQPFVENSLWHGILNSGKKGMLTVSFSFEEVNVDSFTGRSLIIKVTDNGIGITEARKNKKEDHISKGIQIIEERLRLLSEKLQLPQPIMFEDLGSQESGSQGTEVIISLPPPLYKSSVAEKDHPSPPTV